MAQKAKRRVEQRWMDSTSGVSVVNAVMERVSQMQLFQLCLLLLGTFVCSGLARGEIPALREESGERLMIGTAIMSSQLDDPARAALIASQFNCVTAENEMKPDALQPTPGHFTFERADRIVAFAEAHQMKVAGHTLLWHHQSPAWLFQEPGGKPLSREIALNNLKAHITGVVRHFKGKVKSWDVVNEAISDGPEGLRDTPALRAIGDDYVLKAFEFAHEADPDVELIYNDYNIECDYKRDRAIKLVTRIRAAGLRIDGVGIQGHYRLEHPNADEIRRGIQAYVDAGFKVMITELDVDPLPRKGGEGADLSASEREGLDPFRDGLPVEVQTQLAQRYEELFKLFLAFPQVSRVTFWGVTDADSWLNNFPVKGRTNHPLLFDRQGNSKPALQSVVNVLRN